MIHSCDNKKYLLDDLSSNDYVSSVDVVTFHYYYTLPELLLGQGFWPRIWELVLTKSITHVMDRIRVCSLVKIFTFTKPRCFNELWQWPSPGNR